MNGKNTVARSDRKWFLSPNGYVFRRIVQAEARGPYDVTTNARALWHDARGALAHGTLTFMSVAIWLRDCCAFARVVFTFLLCELMKCLRVRSQEQSARCPDFPFTLRIERLRSSAKSNLRDAVPPPTSTGVDVVEV